LRISRNTYDKQRRTRKYSYQENRSMEYFEYALREEDMILFNKVLDERQKE